MALKYLGETIDIHAGGVDLIFPHHENEVAQAEGYTGKPFVKHWFHCEHLFIEGEKMSKSLRNIYTLEEIVDKYNVEPLAFRLLVSMSHYRERLNFTKESIVQAQKTLNNLRNFALSNKESQESESLINLKKFEENFYYAISDDLNTPTAIAVMFELVKEVNTKKAYSQSAYKLLLDFDRILGLSLADITVPKKVQDLFDKYTNNKNKKNFSESDSIREEIQKLGWTTEDSESGSRLRLL